MIIFMWAQDPDFVIGKNNKMPWNIKEEMDFFVKTTKNQNIVMGRLTYDAIEKKPLKNKKSINIISKSVKNGIYNENYFTNIEDVITSLDGDIYIIGGMQIFKLAQKYVDLLYVSQIKKKYGGELKMDKFDIGSKKIKLFNKNFKCNLKKEYETFDFYIYEVIK